MNRLTCGFAIAAQRRARELASAKQFWMADVQNAFQTAVRRGFTGTIKEWMTEENLKALIDRRGCPFTKRDLIKHGWPLAIPYGRPQRRAMWMLVAANGGTLADPRWIEYRYGNVNVSPKEADQACRRNKINPAHVEQIKANVAADPNYYSTQLPKDADWKPTKMKHYFPKNSQE